MNFLKYCEDKLKDPENRKIIISNLQSIQETLEGGSCFDTSLRPGKATGFVINLLQSYFDLMNKKFDSYLEVGVLYGGSLCSLYQSGFKGTAYGLDIYEGYYGDWERPIAKSLKQDSNNHMDLVSNNADKFGGIPILIKCNTQQDDFNSLVSRKIDKLDVLLIDGDHSYNGAISDYQKLFPYLKSGGILLMDNYEMPGVTQSCKEIEKINSTEVLGTWNKTCWMAIKK